MSSVAPEVERERLLAGSHEPGPAAQHDTVMALDSPLLAPDADEPDDAVDLDMGKADLREERSETRDGDLVGTLLVIGGTLTMLLTTWIKIFSAGYGALGLFTFHPTLNVLAICVFALGIWTLQPTMHPRTKKRGLTRHQVIMLGVGIPALVLGTGILVYSKIRDDKPHATTIHGKIGIVSLVWLLVQVVLGGGSVWFNGVLFGRDPKRMWKWHRASGYLLLLLFMVVIWLAILWTTFFRKNASFITILIGFVIAPVAILAGVYLRTRVSKMPLW